MENLINKTRILLWAVIALTILNVATIATIIWQIKSNRNPFHHDKYEMQEKPPHYMGKLIKEKLHLTELQSVSFDSIEKIFFVRSKDIFEKMKVLREEMIEELTNDEPDSSKLINLTKELGDLHIKLKMNTFDFYFSMKKISHPDQQKELSNFFRGMFLFDGIQGTGNGRNFRDGRGPDHSKFGPHHEGNFDKKTHRCDTLTVNSDQKNRHQDRKVNPMHKKHQKDDRPKDQ